MEIHGTVIGGVGLSERRDGTAFVNKLARALLSCKQ